MIVVPGCRKSDVIKKGSCGKSQMKKKYLNFGMFLFERTSQQIIVNVILITYIASTAKWDSCY